MVSYSHCCNGCYKYISQHPKDGEYLNSLLSTHLMLQWHNVVILDRLAKLPALSEIMMIFVLITVLEPAVPEHFYCVNLLI